MRTVSPTLHRRLLDLAAIDAADAHDLVALARSFKLDAAAARSRLRGKNIALLCPRRADAEAGARRFDLAASALGARVAHVDPAPSWLQPEASIGAQAARLFESLYDAVDCEALPHGFAQRLQAELGLPVYDGLAGDDHPLFGLLPQVADDAAAPREEDRRALLQAALVGSLT
jgi:ornithine carbamoyltransferase